MTHAPDRLDEAIDAAARALVTPPPDPHFHTRLVATLPQRPAWAGWWPRLAAALAVAALAVSPWLWREPATTPTSVLETVRVHDTVTHLPAAPTRVVPPAPRLRAGTDVAVAGNVLAAPSAEVWEIPGVSSPEALAIEGLGPSALALAGVEVLPIDVAALPDWAPLDPLKE